MLNLLLIATLSHAEEIEIVYKQKTEIDFEGVDVEGQLVKPEGTLVTEREIAKFNPLIKLRYDFNTEMSQSVSNIK
jgi:hypothetical protein